MKAISRIAKDAFSKFNLISHGEIELLDYCDRKRILFVEHPTESSGEYRLYKGKPAIILDPSLRGGDRLWVFGHEIGHELLHHPYSQTFSGSVRVQNVFYERLDFQANFVAAVLLIPKKVVESKTVGEIAEEYGLPLELILFRKEIYDRYKF